MSKVAKAPPKKTSPVIYLAIAAGVIAAYLVLSPSGTPTSSVTPVKSTKKSSKDAGQFGPADYAALKNPFPPASVAAIDAFNPLIKKTILPPHAPIGKDGGPNELPLNLTGGEPNWYFTGCPSLDGVQTALLENTTSGESVYVKAGDAFKAARVQSVDISTIVLVGPNGASAKIPILGFGETPGSSKSAVASNGPLPVPVGAIGGPLPAAVGPQTATLSNGTTVQLPGNLAPGAANDLNVTPDTNTGNTRRRRNRNRNFGDSTNGF